MSHDRPIPSLADEHTTLDELGPKLVRIAGAVGLVALGLAVVLGYARGDGWQSFGWSYLLGFAFFLSLSLGGLFFVAIGHVTGAVWNVVSRRLAEVTAANLATLALLAVPVMVLAHRVMPWASGESDAPAALLEAKAPFLNLEFFYVRWAIYFVIWCGYAWWFWKRSLEQDTTGDPAISVRMARKSGLCLLLFALSVSFAAYDLLMSLAPSWFSTMFGPYFFAGSFLGFMAFLTLMTFWLQGRGRLRHIIHVEHLHDYGKLMFAFVFFWAYLAFSQYMLIWYANIPEETEWFLIRQSNGWGWIGLVLVFGHFLIPFAGLLAQVAKRRKASLAFWAVWILTMHWVDLYWIVMPQWRPGGPTVEWLDLLTFVGIGGLYVAGLGRLASGRSLVARRDPRIDDSLAFENA
ncbi:MAG: quinol:cytochrome C oxidoreductase [Acidobacteria bacterium]|nr:quinol:cytochrome C oxidoreductase [Acidobacteriota bacterium]